MVPTSSPASLGVKGLGPELERGYLAELVDVGAVQVEADHEDPGRLVSHPETEVRVLTVRRCRFRSPALLPRGGQRLLPGALAPPAGLHVRGEGRRQLQGKAAHSDVMLCVGFGFGRRG